jgi:hypothetical protein
MFPATGIAESEPEPFRLRFRRVISLDIQYRHGSVELHSSGFQNFKAFR